MARERSERAGARPASSRSRGNGGQPRVAATSAAGSAPFASLLQSIIDLAQPTPGAGPGPTGPERRAARRREARPTGGEESPVATTLAQAIDEVSPEAAQKLWVLLSAGRDARDIAAARGAILGSGADERTARRALQDEGPRLAEHLRRGEAIACATGCDLEAALSAWPAEGELDLESRAWSRFGRQLAGSQPDEWQCFAIFDPRERQRVETLYLRMASHQWWSFRRLLDRPSPASVDRERKRGRPVSVSDGTLATMAGQSRATTGHALRRALRAIHARIGPAVESTKSESRRNHG